MIEPMDPDLSAVYEWLGVATLNCSCGAAGWPTDAMHLGGNLWAVTWHTDHGPECDGNRAPGRCYVMDMAALDAGDCTMPGIERPPRARCRATVASTGMPCRFRAYPNGLCGMHGGDHGN